MKIIVAYLIIDKKKITGIKISLISTNCIINNDEIISLYKIY